MALHLITTDDHSHSLRDNSLNEIYHSTRGAVQESMHVYIRSGFEKVAGNFPILNILEIGFGTGLNAWLTFLRSRSNQQAVNYVALEPYPISSSLYTKLNYPELEMCKGDKHAFLNFHECIWNKSIYPEAFFTFIKQRAGIEQFDSAGRMFHLVYFDAFAPDVQPELWTSAIFNKIYSMMHKGGIFVTYSAKGAVRRSLQNVGFRVERIPGPPGKREILRASKDQD